MKKLKILLVSLFIIVLSATVAYAADFAREQTYDDWKKVEENLPVRNSARFLGDLNGDGEVTSEDARFCLRYSVGLDKLNPKQIKAADINCNNEIDSSDARAVLRKSIKLDNLPMPVYKVETLDNFVVGPFASAGSGLYQWECNIKNNKLNVNTLISYYYCPDNELMGASVYSVYSFVFNKAGEYEISLNLVNQSNHQVIDKYDFKIIAESDIEWEHDWEKKELKELLYEVDDLSKYSEEEMSFFINVLTEKLSETSKDKITEIMLDKKISEDMKTNILMICDAHNITVDFNKLKPILVDKSYTLRFKNFLFRQMNAEKHAD